MPSTEKEDDTQSPAGQGQQVSQLPAPCCPPQELPVGWRRWEPRSPACPLLASIPLGSRLPPASLQDPAGVCWGGRSEGRSQLRAPRCCLSPHCSRSPPQGSAAASPEEGSQKGRTETCHVSPLTMLPAHPAERGEEGPWQRDGAGGREHTLPGRSDAALHSPHTPSLCRQCREDGDQGWGLPAPAKPLDHALRGFNEGQ